MSSGTADTTCANCGTGEEDENKLKACTACKLVRYCSRDCQKAHWPRHKKACKKRAAELRDQELLKDHPESEECPICMIALPVDPDQVMFKACCGKTICCGCIHAQTKEDINNGKEFKYLAVCPFCRAPQPETDEELVALLEKGMEKNFDDAYDILALSYMNGDMGLPKDLTRARELFMKAVELGNTSACAQLGEIYRVGNGVKTDLKKAKYYFELGAIGGGINARQLLGCMEWDAGNHVRACKHFLIGAKTGVAGFLENIKLGFTMGYVTKDEYAEALRTCQEQQEKTKSAMRDEALIYCQPSPIL